MTNRAQFAFAPGLALAVSGDAATVRHFGAEYGASQTDRAVPACVDVAFGDAAAPVGEQLTGGHKSVSWVTALSEPEAATLVAQISLSGRPRGFARSLTQGYFVEPLMSVAAERAGLVLLPAAAFADPDGATVVVGLSGAGKTSLSTYALAIGVPVYGDDQVIVDAAGFCSAFPRRLRLYPDLRDGVPVAYRRLPPLVRARLGFLRIVRVLSRGTVAPSLAVSPRVFGGAVPEPAPIRRVVILERTSASGELRVETAGVADAVSYGLRALREQRSHLAFGGRDSWHRALCEIERHEAELLGAAFAGAAVSRVVVPPPLRGEAIVRVGLAAGLQPRPQLARQAIPA